MLKLTMVPREELHDDRRASINSPRYDEHLDVLSVMLKQENTYASIDYLSVIRSKQQKDLEGITKSASTYKGGKDLPLKLVDEFCRDQITEWKFRVMDYFKVDREIISISMNYLDRYLSMVPLCDRRTFKRAATAALHLAVKVHQPDKMRMIGVLSDLSRGEFEMADIAEFESVISESLDWRLHPPTSICLVTRLMAVIPMIPSTPVLEDDEMATCLLDFSLFFAELSVCDYALAVTQKSSTVAIASLFNAMEGLGLLSSAAASSRYLQDFCELIGPSSEIDMEALAFTKERLWNLYENSEEFSLTQDQEAQATTSSDSAAADPSTPTRDSPSNSTNAKAVSVVSDSSSPICVSRHVRAAAAVLA